MLINEGEMTRILKYHTSLKNVLHNKPNHKEKLNEIIGKYALYVISKKFVRTFVFKTTKCINSPNILKCMFVTGLYEPHAIRTHLVGEDIIKKIFLSSK